MDLVVTRTIGAPIDRVWALQLAHTQWPEHLPNFSTVERHSPDTPFGIGSVAAVTQPGLGTVDWTVTEFAETPSRCTYTWTGGARGVRYLASHLVEARPDGGSQLTLGIIATGATITLMGWMLRRSMTKAIAAEAAAFEQWALEG